MAWIYLAESEESHTPSGTTFDLSPTAKSTPIVKRSCSTEWFQEIFALHPYGMTYGLWKSEKNPWSTFFMEGSLVRTLALRAMEKVWQESVVGFIGKSSGSPKRLNLHSFFWKTCEELPVWEDTKSSPRLPKSGMIFDGVFYPLRDAERLTKEKDGGCLPTPMAQEAGRTYEQHMEMKRKMGRSTCTSLSAWVEGLLPTPKASECKRAGIKSESKRDNPRLWYRVYEATGKKINPPFVEWMMGFPIGWTELNPWATQWFLNARKKRLKS